MPRSIALVACITLFTLSSCTTIQVAPTANLAADKPTVLITGSNRGIGLEFVKQFSERGWNIIATARKPEEAADLQAIADNYDRLAIEQLDVTDFDRVKELQTVYQDQPIDILLSNAGITPKYKSAFKKVSGVDWDMARKSIDVNAIAPLQIAHIFMGNVAASDQKKIVVISSKGGSFAVGPEMPMMYSYRASKAALNMYMYTLSFETPKKDVILTLLSPGQVNTVPGMKLPNAIETDESVSKMLAVIDNLTPQHNGKFLDYEDGSEIGW
ncbi:MAG: SDR family oxidoreductase [Gammaproteobacteria bacterium]|jgi:NAD(P)-dependent dehydrogenase (short-subunit alcohol dehydrogenase family)|nr:SDR family oxidoreductase [Gammaproteobacteria bacterium]MDP6617708.1 SDR family oxidoreductase [Gammaproteobacteria bacterium]MDP6695683.1 SDR family oxidoreductase [Gammaproteobacteria bacterium]